MAKKNQLTKSDYLSQSDFKKLLNGLHEDKQYIWELYARISFCTALRSSDVLSLRWSDVINKNEIVKVEKKTGKTRRVPINDSIKNKIQNLYNILDRPNRNDLIFVSKITGRAMTIQYINNKTKAWKIRYKLTLGNFSTHTFRKTFGRYIYDSTENKSEALVILNSIFKHSSIDITKVYIGLREDEINSAFNLIQF